jgi:putative transposase
MEQGGIEMAKPSGRHRNKSKGLGVIWEIPDELWERIEPILVEYWPRKATGRRCADWRRALNGIIFRMRSGCQWNRLPRQFGDDSTVHRWFQRWNKDGVMERIWAALVEDCAELGGVNWQWQAADAAMAKARFGGKKRAETPRIAANRGPSGACSSRNRAGRWGR